MENEIDVNSQEYQNFIKINSLKQELAKIKEDLEQVETFRMVRDDYEKNIARGAEIINEIRILEGKPPREIYKQNSEIISENTENQLTDPAQ